MSISILRYVPLLLALSLPAFAQTSGRAFALSFLPNPGSGEGARALTLYLLSERDAVATIEAAGSVRTVSVPAGGITAVDLPLELIPSGGVEEKGVLVSVTDSVVLVALNQAPGAGGSWLVYPVATLDTMYVLAGWSIPDTGAPWGFSVVAVEDDTELRIGGSTAAELIRLDRGGTYYEERSDSTPLRLHASRPVGVMMGAASTGVPRLRGSDAMGRGHLCEQAIPISRVDSMALVVPHPTTSRPVRNTFRAVALLDSTRVSVNGVERGMLREGEYLQEEFDASRAVSADGPLIVMQLEMSADPLEPGDPSLFSSPPSGQGLPAQTFLAIPRQPYSRHFALISIPANAISSLRLDGAPLPDTLWWTYNGVAGESFAILEVEPGRHRMHSTIGAPFALRVLGYGVDDGYAYVAGLAMRRTLERFDRFAPAVAGRRSISCRMEEIIVRDTGLIRTGLDWRSIEQIRMEGGGVLRMEFSADSSEVRLTIAIDDRTRETRLHVHARDRAGNLGRIDLAIPATARGGIDRERVVVTGQMLASRCDSIAIDNREEYPLTLVEARLSGNTRLSLPPSALPVTIAPGERVYVPLCIARGTGAEPDTLYLFDSCGLVQARPLAVRVDPLRGVDGCGDLLLISAEARAGSRRAIVSLRPSVADGRSVTVDMRSNRAGSLEAVALDGSVVARVDVMPAEGIMAVPFPTAGLPAGFYLLRFRSGGEISIGPGLICR